MCTLFFARTSLFVKTNTQRHWYVEPAKRNDAVDYPQTALTRYQGGHLLARLRVNTQACRPHVFHTHILV